MDGSKSNALDNAADNDGLACNGEAAAADEDAAIATACDKIDGSVGVARSTNTGSCNTGMCRAGCCNAGPSKDKLSFANCPCAGRVSAITSTGAVSMDICCELCATRP